MLRKVESTPSSCRLGRVAKGLALTEEEGREKLTTAGLATNEGEGEKVMRSGNEGATQNQRLFSVFTRYWTLEPSVGMSQFREPTTLCWETTPQSP